MLSELRKQQDVWVGHALNNYHYNISLDCALCPTGPNIGPNQLNFENGVIVRQIYIGKTRLGYEDSGEYISGQEVSGEYILNNTIEELFKEIERLLKKDSNIFSRRHVAKNVFMDLQYHQEFGFPTKIWRSDMSVMGGAFSIRVENFVPN